jgi:hypothetical protein
VRGFPERRIAFIAGMNIQTSCGLAFQAVPTANGGEFSSERVRFLLTDVTVATGTTGEGALSGQIGHARLVGLFTSRTACRRYIVAVNAIGTSARLAEETGFHAGLFLSSRGLQGDALVVVDVVLSARHDDGCGCGCETIQASLTERMESEEWKR